MNETTSVVCDGCEGWDSQDGCEKDAWDTPGQCSFADLVRERDARIAKLEARVDRQSKLILAKEEVKQELLGLLERALTVLPSSRHPEDESWVWVWDTLSSEAQAEVEEVWDELQAALKVKEKEE